MLRYLLKRTLWGLISLIVFVSVLFFLVQILIPGDFVTQFAMSTSREEQEALSESLGLDMPLWERYLDWLGDLVRLDLGTSFTGFPRQSIPTLEVIRGALPYTALLLLGGALVAFLIGYQLGKWSGWRKSGVGTGIVTFGSLALYSSFPPWIAYLVVVVFVPRVRHYVMVFPNSIVNWLYAAGFSVPSYAREHASNPTRATTTVLLSLVVAIGVAIALRKLVGRFVDSRLSGLTGIAAAALGVIATWQATGFSPQGFALVRIAALPVATFVILSFAEALLIMEAAISGVRSESYIAAAQAKGLPGTVVRDRHAARVAVLPALARLIVTLPYLMTAIIMVESLFAWPGLGSQLWGAIVYQDIPLLMGLLLFIGLLTLVGRLVLEVLQVYFDPRLRIQAGQPRETDASARRELLFDLSPRGSVSELPARLRRLGQSARRSWRSLKIDLGILTRSRLAKIGIVLLIVMLIMAVSHPILIRTVWPRGVYDPITGYDLTVQHPAPVSARHPLGTTLKGTDVLSLLLAATGHSFTLGLTAGLAAAFIGSILGVLAAYLRGRSDAVLSQISFVFLLLPAPIFMVIAGALYKTAGPLELGITYGIIAGLGNTAIVMRTYGLTIVTKPYIESARAAGGSAVYIIRRHVLPNMLPMAVLQMLLAVSGAVVVDGFLSFLGTTRYVVNWGTMLAESALLYEYLGHSVQWHAILPPVIAFSVFGLAFYLISRGMLQVVDPRLRRIW